MRKALLLWAFCCSAGWSAEPSDIGLVLASSLPEAFWETLRASDEHETYALSAWLNPFYLQGDFNGDGHTDFAVLIEEKSTNERGVLIMHVGKGQHFVIGAGSSIDNGGADFYWMDAWQVYPQGVVEPGLDVGQQPPALSGDALLVIKTEAASGLVYWTGTRYAWYQQGD